MIASERKLYILRHLNEHGVINLKDVAQALGISETTVRRDFEKLEQEGKLNRVQGGAMISTDVEDVLESAESSMRGKKNLNRQEKHLVAEQAAQLVRDGDSIFIDCGTTLLPLANILLKRAVHIVTNSTLLVSSSSNLVASLILVGGKYHPNHNLLSGPLAKQMVNEFHFDHAFIGCFGVSMEQKKAFTLDVDSAEIKLAGMQNADRCHLLVDHSKFGRKGFFGFADLSMFEHVYCDAFPDVDTVPENFILAHK